MSRHRGRHRLRLRLKRVAGRHVAGPTALLLLAALVSFGAVTGSAAANKGGDDKVTICHRTNSTSNPYVQISVAVSAVDGDSSNDHGQGDHYAEHTGPVWDSSMPNGGNWGDIIPPVAGVHGGLNWTAAGQAIYNNGCNPPAPPMAKYLTYQTVCGQITFNNPNAFAVDVQYDADGAPGGSFEESASVPANGSKGVATTLDVFRFYAYGSDGNGTVLEQDGSVQMPTDCGPDLEMVYGDVTFYEGSVACVDNQVVYTKPTYVVAGNEHVVYDTARGEHTAEFGQSVTVNATGVNDDAKYELAGQTTWSHTFGPKPEAPKNCGTPPEEQVTICHATGSDSNPYVLIENLSPAGVFNGHLDDDFGGTHGDHQNGEDIIPPFEYQGQTYSQNWDADGQAIFNNGCKVPDEPEPAEPTVNASSDACVNPGENTGVVDVTVTNTDDDTNDTVTYDVTLDGDTKQVTIDDGQSGSVQFTGLAPGTYTVSVTGDDGTSTSTTVTVKECDVPPEPAEPTVQAAAQGCVNQGASNGVVTVVVTNTDDDTDETVTYQVTLDGITKSVTIADDSSDSLEFTGLAPGAYEVMVVGDDDTSASTTVTVKECDVPPVFNPDGDITTGCLGNARWVLDNHGSNQPVFFEVVAAEENTSLIRLVKVNAGDRKVIRHHGLQPGTVLTLRALDAQLDREVVPGECEGDNPPPPPPTHEPPATADTGVGTGSVPWLPLGGGIAALLLLSGAALYRSGREQAA